MFTGPKAPVGCTKSRGGLANVVADYRARCAARSPSLVKAWPIAAKPVAWCPLATALLFVLLPGGDPTALPIWLGDTDDAVRLVTVRELLAVRPASTPRCRASARRSRWFALVAADRSPLALPAAAVQAALRRRRARRSRRAWSGRLCCSSRLLMMVSQEAMRRAGPLGRRLRARAG